MRDHNDCKCNFVVNKCGLCCVPLCYRRHQQNGPVRLCLAITEIKEMDIPDAIVNFTRHSKNTHTNVENYFSVNYERLKAIARIQLRRIVGNDTFNATELVHETYLKLASDVNASINDESFFCACIANSMRHIIVDNLRKKYRIKRGCEYRKVLHSTIDIGIDEQHSCVVDINNSIRKLGRKNKRAAEVVLFRYFYGFNIKDTAKCLNISEKTVKNDWDYARTWLKLYFKTDL